MDIKNAVAQAKVVKSSMDKLLQGKDVDGIVNQSTFTRQVLADAVISLKNSLDPLLNALIKPPPLLNNLAVL